MLFIEIAQLFCLILNFCKVSRFLSSAVRPFHYFEADMNTLFSTMLSLTLYDFNSGA